MKFFLLESILLICFVSAAFALQPKDCRCRVQSSRRILGESQARTWPWHLSLGWRASRVNGNFAPESAKIQRHHCGAIILNENWALTVADCVYDSEQKMPLRPEAFNLGYESNDLVELWDQNKLVDVDRIVFHPSYNPKSEYNWLEANLALLKVKTQFKFGDHVQPACLELDHPRKIYKEQLVGIGFGVTNVTYNDESSKYELGQNSRFLKESSLKDESTKSEFCSDKDLDETICLFSSDALCKGDEGGPVHRQANGKATVVALASYFYSEGIWKGPSYNDWATKPCAGSANFIHLAAQRFIKWIEETVGGEYCH